MVREKASPAQEANSSKNAAGRGLLDRVGLPPVAPVLEASAPNRQTAATMLPGEASQSPCFRVIAHTKAQRHTHGRLLHNAWGGGVSPHHGHHPPWCLCSCAEPPPSPPVRPLSPLSRALVVLPSMARGRPRPPPPSRLLCSLQFALSGLTLFDN